MWTELSSSVAFNVIVNWPTSDLSLHFHNAVSLDLHKNVFKPVPLIAAPSASFTIFKSFYRKETTLSSRCSSMMLLHLKRVIIFSRKEILRKHWIVFERTKHKLTFDLKLLEIFYQNLFYKALLPWWTA